VVHCQRPPCSPAPWGVVRGLDEQRVGSVYRSGARTPGATHGGARPTHTGPSPPTPTSNPTPNPSPLHKTPLTSAPPPPIPHTPPKRRRSAIPRIGRRAGSPKTCPASPASSATASPSSAPTPTRRCAPPRARGFSPVTSTPSTTRATCWSKTCLRPCTPRCVDCPPTV
jgi:hypothetical protein